MSLDVGAHLSTIVATSTHCVCAQFLVTSVLSTCVSQREHTNAYTLAQVLERVKSVRLHHRISIFRLCIALVQQIQHNMMQSVALSETIRSVSNTLAARKMYADQRTTVMTDVESDEFMIARGTKQG